MRQSQPDAHGPHAAQLGDDLADQVEAGG